VFRYPSESMVPETGDRHIGEDLIVRVYPV
jgi:hypothetical protein